MTDDALQKFIAHARSKDMDHATIRMLLLANGWKDKDVMRVLSAQELEMPIPLPPDTGGAREAFAHLLVFGFLYITLISVIVLFFTYINRLFPDLALEQAYLRDAELSSIRRSLAAIIVGFPLLLWMSRAIVRDIALHPDRAASGIRRWLTYLTLLVTSSSVVGTLITLIFFLLEGELSVRFLLKVFVVLTLAGLTFAYYFLSLRVEPTSATARRVHRSFFVCATSVVIVAIVWGAVIIGSPMKERERKFDERRVEDLRAIQQEVLSIVYGGMQYDLAATMVQQIPQTLDDVVVQARLKRLNTIDPQTGEPYGYIVLSERAVNLCATFNFEQEYEYDVFWNHPAGEYCFTIDIVTDKNR
ncbi:MAG: DUF5671 domain-containing protein [Candidatus Peribacteraceae bacterium]|jgi:hypothetical protein